MLSSSKHQTSLGRVACPLEFTRLYTLCRGYHIGESLIPSVRRYLKFIDAEEKVADYGFEIKIGLLRGLTARDSRLEARSCNKVQSAQEGRIYVSTVPSNLRNWNLTETRPRHGFCRPGTQ